MRRETADGSNRVRMIKPRSRNETGKIKPPARGRLFPANASLPEFELQRDDLARFRGHGELAAAELAHLRFVEAAE